jgi:7,8-dihydroneopterin aldolase/epimerase/oxygenase
MEENMSSNQCWRIHVKNMETVIHIGIHDHEKSPQRIIVNAVIEAQYALKPKTIKECFSYEHIYKLVVEQWPKRPHIHLLESCVVELLEHVFRIDDSVMFAQVSVCKPDIFPEADAVGVEAQWTREDYIRLTAGGNSPE